MSMQKLGARRVAFLGMTLAITGALGIALGTALADRSATAPPIVYSGQILMGSTPLSDGAHDVGLSLWSTPSGATGGLCDMAPSSVTTTAGHFSLALSADCANVFETEEEVYVQLVVDSTTLGRMRAGAVPFAVSAERVVLRSSTGNSVTSSGLFCAYSATATPGRISVTVGPDTTVGYGAAHILCASACGSPTAHVCSPQEAVHTAELGGFPMAPSRYAWLAGGTLDVREPGNYTTSDCVGFTELRGAPNFAGHVWDTLEERPDQNQCSDSMSIACCD